MIIVYYKKRDTGEFTNVHDNHGHATMETLAQAIEKYNEGGHQTTAGVVEVADDSLEAYLFKTRHMRANLDREAIRDAIDALETALDNVRYLEG